MYNLNIMNKNMDTQCPSMQVINIQPNGKAFVNGIYSQLPFSVGKLELHNKHTVLSM